MLLMTVSGSRYQIWYDCFFHSNAFVGRSGGGGATKHFHGALPRGMSSMPAYILLWSPNVAQPPCCCIDKSHSSIRWSISPCDISTLRKRNSDTRNWISSSKGAQALAGVGGGGGGGVSGGRGLPSLSQGSPVR